MPTVCSWTSKGLGVVGWDCGSGGRFLLGVAFRSGLLCVALSKKAAAAACKLFAERVVGKQYLALVEGRMLQGCEVNEEIAHHPTDSFKMCLGTPQHPGNTAVEIGGCTA